MGFFNFRFIIVVVFLPGDWLSWGRWLSGVLFSYVLGLGVVRGIGALGHRGSRRISGTTRRGWVLHVWRSSGLESR